MRMVKNLIVAGFALVSMGCGSATNNDQGVSFTFLGFFEDNAGANTASSLTTTLGSITDTETSDGTDTSLLTYFGTANNLSGQFIRTQRAYISYRIPGSAVQPPDTSVAYSAFLAPADAGNSSLPPGAGGASATNFSKLPVITSAVKTWLNLQRNSLPEAPFDIEATASVVGATSAGDVYESNIASITISVLPDVVIPPTEGTVSDVVDPEAL